MGTGRKAVMTGGTDCRCGRNLRIIIRICHVSARLDGCGQSVLVNGNFVCAAACVAGPAVVEVAGVTDMTKVVYATSVAIDDDPVLAEAMQVLIRCVYGMNHILHVNGLFRLPVSCGSAVSRTHADIRGIGVMAHHTDLDLVCTIAPVQTQRLMALVAVVNIHDCSTVCSGGISDGEALEHARYRDPVINIAVPILVTIRMPLQTNNSGSGYARWDCITYS